jgi:hypothetical protein
LTNGFVEVGNDEVEMNRRQMSVIGAGRCDSIRVETALV